MIIKLKIEKVYNVRYLQVSAGVRYWEDASIDGVEDTDGDLVPCRISDTWCPLVNVDTGIIENWEQGRTANIHYKICDDGIYSLLDSSHNLITKINGYVPVMMCPGDKGYGDYIIMKVDESGKIDNWCACFDEFTSTEEN